MEGYTIYIAGESYAGYYVPYIADAMLNKKDKEYYNLNSIMIYDPALSFDVVQEQIPAVPFVEYWGPLLNLNATFMSNIQERAAKCNYTSYMEKYMVFPPKGPLPTPPDETVDGCDIWDDVMTAATWANPCFDVYQVATTCPLLYDVLGFPGDFDYTPVGGSVYFNRSDVQKVIHAPPTNWAECTTTNVFVNGTDNSPPSGLSVLPGVIERTERTIIGHGLLDFILIYNGTLLVIQNVSPEIPSHAWSLPTLTEFR
jgi:carboxypeptidase D